MGWEWMGFKFQAEQDLDGADLIFFMIRKILGEISPPPPPIEQRLQRERNANTPTPAQALHVSRGGAPDSKQESDSLVFKSRNKKWEGPLFNSTR
ncbi:hypothetical protein QQP08_000363 [Theobroma cacao]|nr:hypothetical protein QQP08_000363 [Theobroma cacao]